MRAPGIEPEQKAWKALIITPRSHPQNQGLNTIFVLVFYYYKKRIILLLLKKVKKIRKFLFSKKCS
jgi:hypothetical protein